MARRSGAAINRNRNQRIAPPSGLFQLYDSGSEESDSEVGNNRAPATSSQRHRNGSAVGGSGPGATSSSVWVFGYGSLCWNPGFEFSKCVTGYIRGYVRRFWQGNDAHRGTKEKPGRVATLVKDPHGITWGCAYKVVGSAAFEYLNQRECTLGGYITEYVKFYPRVASDDINGEAFPSLLYVATDGNAHWLGEDSVPAIARQICESSGPSGHNVEYLMRLAQFMHDELSGADDDHLFELERCVLSLLKQRRISLGTLMGTQPQTIRRDSYEDARRPRSFEHTSRVPDVKLRCLNI